MNPELQLPLNKMTPSRGASCSNWFPLSVRTHHDIGDVETTEADVRGDDGRDGTFAEVDVKVGRGWDGDSVGHGWSEVVVGIKTGRPRLFGEETD